MLTDTAIAAPSFAISHVWLSVEVAVMPVCVIGDGSRQCGRRLSSRHGQLCSPTLPSLLGRLGRVLVSAVSTDTAVAAPSSAAVSCVAVDGGGRGTLRGR